MYYIHISVPCPRVLKIVPKADYDMYTGEYRPMTEEERNSDSAFSKIFIIRKNIHLLTQSL